MQAYHILNDMIDHQLAVVIRGDDEDMARKTADACANGGVNVLEVTFTVPGAPPFVRVVNEGLSSQSHCRCGDGAG